MNERSFALYKAGICANIYDLIYFFKYAVEKMGVTDKPEDLSKDRKKIMKGFTTLKGFKVMTGPTAFSEDGAEVKGGKWFINR